MRPGQATGQQLVPVSASHGRMHQRQLVTVLQTHILALVQAVSPCSVGSPYTCHAPIPCHSHLYFRPTGWAQWWQLHAVGSPALYRATMWSAMLKRSLKCQGRWRRCIWSFRMCMQLSTCL